MPHGTYTDEDAERLRRLGLLDLDSLELPGVAESVWRPSQMVPQPLPATGGPPATPRPTVSDFNDERHHRAVDAMQGVPPETDDDYGLVVPAFNAGGPSEPSEWAQMPSRKPARAALTRGAVSPAVREYMLKRLRDSQRPVDPDEVLPSQGATVWSAMQPGLAGLRNAMLAGAGLPQTARPTDVAGAIASDKAKLAEWARRRRGEGDEAAQRLLAADAQERQAELNAQRTAAYEEAMRAAADRGTRRSDIEERRLELTEERGKSKDALEREKIAARAAGAKAKADAKEAKEAAKAEGLVIPYYGGVDLQPRSSAIRDTDASRAREIASRASATLGGMDDLESAISDYVARPGLETKNSVGSKVQIVATAMNVALDQGAMSDSEKNAINEALGANVLTPSGVAAVVESLTGSDPAQAGKLLLSRLRSAKSAFQNAAAAKLRAYGYEVPKAGAQPSAPSGGGGAVTIRQKSTGKTKVLPREQAVRFIGQEDFEEVK